MYEQVADLEICTKALASYTGISSITDLKRIFDASTIIKYRRSAMVDYELFKEKFCVLIKGTVRHYMMDSDSGEEQTSRFTFSGEILYMCGGLEEEMQCISDGMILAIPYAVLQEFGEDVHLKKYMQQIILKNMEFEISLLRMQPEMRYKELTKRCRDIFLIVPLKHIASFLGITPQALCRIRKRLLYILVPLDVTLSLTSLFPF